LFLSLEYSTRTSAYTQFSYSLKLKKANHKPGSVIFVERINAVVYHLSSSKLTLGINQPTLRDWASNPQASVYLVFQFVRFTLPLTSLPKRWALTSPFHLFLWANSRVVFLSVALSVPNGLIH